MLIPPLHLRTTVIVSANANASGIGTETVLTSAPAILLLLLHRVTQLTRTHRLIPPAHHTHHASARARPRHRVGVLTTARSRGRATTAMPLVLLLPQVQDTTPLTHTATTHRQLLLSRGVRHLPDPLVPLLADTTTNVTQVPPGQLVTVIVNP